MKEPRIALDKQADSIAEEAVTMNLYPSQITYELREATCPYSVSPLAFTLGSGAGRGLRGFCSA